MAKKIEVTNGVSVAVIVESSLAAWAARGWHLASEPIPEPAAVINVEPAFIPAPVPEEVEEADLHLDSPETLEVDNGSAGPEE